MTITKTLGFTLLWVIDNFAEDDEILKLNILISTSQRIIKLMNLAGFLHSLKEFKDSTLSLPIAPVFSLPSQKWHFSSPALVPLRKRKENTSFFKYLEQLDLMGEKKQSQEKVCCNRQLLCLYENKDYLDDKINHIFNKIYMECRSEVHNRQRIRCECVSEEDEKNSVTFVLSMDAIKATLQASKKSFKSETPINKEHSINWSQFARILTKQQTSEILRFEDELHFYKIPESITQQTSVFNLFWNDNFIVFSNNHMPVNQHMKAKAVELSDLLNRKLQEFIWKKVEMFIQKAEEINEYDMFIKKARKIMKINSFRIWFYKKQENNEIYILGLSDLSFKGVQCMLFKDVSFKHLEMKVNELEIDQEYNNFQKNKNIECGREKLKSLREVNKLNDINDVLNFRFKPKVQKNASQKLQITQIQCSCCRNLLLSNQIVNQITANKIQQVRYLRQIKIGKIQFDPFDFVKVCTTCYSVYLKYYKQSISKSKSLKFQKTQKAHSFYEKNQKENSNNKVSKEANFYLQKKIDEINPKSVTPSLRGLVRDRSLNIRAKSELNNSKEGQKIQGNLEVQIQKRFYFNNNRKKEPPRNLIPQNQRKYKTAITTNTQTVDLEAANQKVTIKDQIVLERTLTNNEKPTNSSFQKDFLPKSRSFKLKGGGIPKHVNIINKIIMNTTNQVDKVENVCSNIPKFKQQEHYKRQQQLKLLNHKDFSEVGDGKSWNTKKERETVITNAIEEYENISRPSFKKLIYKGHKNNLKRQMNLMNENMWQQEKLQNRRKKSIFSYCEQ